MKYRIRIKANVVFRTGGINIFGWRIGAKTHTLPLDWTIDLDESNLSASMNLLGYRLVAFIRDEVFHLTAAGITLTEVPLHDIIDGTPRIFNWTLWKGGPRATGSLFVVT
jgi:hypothetical protein